MAKAISKEDLIGAHNRIKAVIHQTPVLTSKMINNLLGCELFFKCENFQKVGAFKIRGATNVVLQLSDEEKSRGVVTHSSGNHAQALALAAKLSGISATVVMPKNAPQVKIEAVKSYGAQIIFCEPNLKAREQAVDAVIRQKDAVFVHPYNDERIISGQASAAKELFEEINSLDYIIAPVGGGGLLSGTSLAAKYFSAQTKVIGAEPTGADDAQKSLLSGKLIEQKSPNTIADGLLTSLGDITFNIIKNNVDQILTVDDKEIAQAMKLIFERLKIIVEPSAAVVLAVVLKNRKLFQNSRTGLILSGGNLDWNKLPF